MRHKLSSLAFFASFAKAKRTHFTIPLAFAMFMAIQESMMPFCIKLIIDRTGEYFTNPVPIWGLLLGPILLYLGLTELTNIFFRLRDYFKLAVFPALKSDVVMHTYQYLLGHSYAFFQDNYTGTLVSKTSDLMRGIESLLTMIVDMFLWRTLSLFIAVIALYFAHPYFSLFVLLWSIVFISLTVKLSTKSAQLSKSFSQSRSHLFGALSDSLSNIFNILLFHNLKHEKSKIKGMLYEYQTKEKKMLKKALTIGLIQGIFVTGFTAVMVVGLVYAAENHYVTLGDFAFVITLSGTIIRNVYSVSSDLIQFSKEIGICQQALSLYQTKPTIMDDPDAIELKQGKGKISFKGVRFSYPDGHQVFRNLDFEIKPGQKVGVVGASGVGKTTLSNLLLRFYDLDAGAIEIDDVRIDKLTLSSLRAQMSVIPQEPILFNRTILENIQFGQLDASLDKVQAVVRAAQLEDFVSGLEHGLHTMVGERGVKLSGGQKQRIAIARALLKDAPIIIMDEPTSALDAQTEKVIFEVNQSLLKNKTALIIAHRLSTLQTLDTIIVLNKEGIVEQGSHQALLTQNGLYAKMWHLQAKTHESDTIIDDDAFDGLMSQV